MIESVGYWVFVVSRFVLAFMLLMYIVAVVRADSKSVIARRAYLKSKPKSHRGFSRSVHCIVMALESNDLVRIPATLRSIRQLRMRNVRVTVLTTQKLHNAAQRSVQLFERRASNALHVEAVVQRRYAPKRVRNLVGRQSETFVLLMPSGMLLNRTSITSVLLRMQHDDYAMAVTGPIVPIGARSSRSMYADCRVIASNIMQKIFNTKLRVTRAPLLVRSSAYARLISGDVRVVYDDLFASAGTSGFTKRSGKTSGIIISVLSVVELVAGAYVLWSGIWLGITEPLIVNCALFCAFYFVSIVFSDYLTIFQKLQWISLMPAAFSVYVLNVVAVCVSVLSWPIKRSRNNLQLGRVRLGRSLIMAS